MQLKYTGPKYFLNPYNLIDWVFFAAQLAHLLLKLIGNEKNNLPYLKWYLTINLDEDIIFEKVQVSDYDALEIGVNGILLMLLTLGSILK